MAKKWTWRQAPGSSHTGGASDIKRIQTPIWCWQFDRNGGGLYDKRDKIYEFMAHGRHTAGGSLISDMEVVEVSFDPIEPDPWTHSDNVAWKYYNGGLVVDHKTDIFSYRTGEFLNGAKQGRLYYIGYFWRGNEADTDRDCQMIYYSGLTSFGPQEEIDGHRRYADTYYSFKHLTELAERQNQVAGTDKYLAQGGTSHNRNTYYSVVNANGTKGRQKIEYYGGDGLQTSKAARFKEYDDIFNPSLIPGFPNVILYNETISFYANTVYMNGTTPNIEYYIPDLKFHVIGAEQALGYYDEFRLPDLYIVKTLDRYRVDPMDNVFFSGFVVLGGPTS